MENTLNTEDQFLAASQMREAQAQSRMAGQESEEQEPEGGWGDVREARNAARKSAVEKDWLKKKTEKVKEKVGTPARAATSQLLQKAWLSIGTVLAFIFLGLPYINFHVFARWVFGDMLFCKLGEEWIPKKAVAAAGDAVKTGSKGIGLAEVMALILLDMVALILITLIIVNIVLLVNFVTMSWWDWDFIKLAFRYIFE